MHSERCLEIGHCRWRATTFARRWVNNLGWRRKLVFLLQLSCDGGKDNSRAFTRQSQITLGGMRPNLSGKNLMGLLRPKVPSFSFDKISLPVQREFIHPSLFPDKILKMAIWAVKKVTLWRIWLPWFFDKSWYVEKYHAYGCTEDLRKYPSAFIFFQTMKGAVLLGEQFELVWFTG